MLLGEPRGTGWINQSRMSSGVGWEFISLWVKRRCVGASFSVLLAGFPRVFFGHSLERATVGSRARRGALPRSRCVALPSEPSVSSFREEPSVHSKKTQFSRLLPMVTQTYSPFCPSDRTLIPPEFPALSAAPHAFRARRAGARRRRISRLGSRSSSS